MFDIIISIVIVFFTALFLLWSALHTYFKFRGARLITCPETREPAAVDVDARHAALLLPIVDRGLRLKECSRWPERKDCGQECLLEIESSPEDCLVRTILTKWYLGRKCIVCGKSFGEIAWLDHKPALMSPGKPSLEWREIPPENLPTLLVTHMPVCWDCHIVEKFRRRYPELVVDRPWRPGESHRST
jgi:hypothetical protein